MDLAPRFSRKLQTQPAHLASSVKLCLFLMGLASGCAVPAAGEPSPSQNIGTWPQWRGPERNGIVEGSPWPGKLDSTQLKQMWRHEIGEGYAGPIVSTDRVFTVETRKKRQEVVRAFDRISGTQVWETAWDGAMKVPFFAARNGRRVRYSGGSQSRPRAA